jgi:hypothetical protein
MEDENDKIWVWPLAAMAIVALAAVVGSFWTQHHQRASLRAAEPPPYIQSSDLGLAVPSPPHASECFDVQLSKVSAAQFRMTGYNHCAVTLPTVVVLVKFFDGQGRRVGVGSFAPFYVAAHEKEMHVFPAPPEVWGLFSRVAVREITEDLSEARK